MPNTYGHKRHGTISARIQKNSCSARSVDAASNGVVSQVVMHFVCVLVDHRAMAEPVLGVKQHRKARQTERTPQRGLKPEHTTSRVTTP